MEKTAAGKGNKKKIKYDPKWAEAKTRCRLNANDVEMAKRLGFTPKALLRNIPGPKESWKQPVKFWIRDLYREKYGSLIGEENEVNLADDLPF